MHTYRIHFKGHYHELSEWKHYDVTARTQLSALRKFFRFRRQELEDADLLDGAGLPGLSALDINTEYRWWEGDWLEVYKGIEELSIEPCPLCQGQGEVSKEVARQFAGLLTH